MALSRVQSLPATSLSSTKTSSSTYSDDTTVFVPTEQDATKTKLIDALKKEVKMVMSESVVKKFLNEDSTSVTSLCHAIDQCLRNGLRRRALGFFSGPSNSTIGLLYKSSAECEAARETLVAIEQLQNANPDSPLSKSADGASNGHAPLKATLSSPLAARLIWIRIALVKKTLAPVIAHLVKNYQKFYLPDSLLGDTVRGPIFMALLDGPCQLEFTRLKKLESSWLDPNADELMARQRLHAVSEKQATKARPDLKVRHNHNSSTYEADSITEILAARDYVESLHQNSRLNLLYGKNNVCVQPRAGAESMPGYLSLHQAYTNEIYIKWTPNQLLQGCCSFDETEEEEEAESPRTNPSDKRFPWSVCDELPRFVPYSPPSRLYWRYALTISLSGIGFIHAHSLEDGSAQLVFIATDGVQYAPFSFLHHTDLMAFIACIEMGIAPSGKLDPPVGQKRKARRLPLEDPIPNGKVLPKLKRRISKVLGRESSNESRTSITSEDGELAPFDQIYRVDLSYPASTSTPPPSLNNTPAPSNRTSDTSDKPSDELVTPTSPSHLYTALEETRIRLMCDTMRNQILSRAFYGWLAYVRHLNTVRTHLSALIQCPPISLEGSSQPFNENDWENIRSDPDPDGALRRLYQHVYENGITNLQVRKKVWPFLLGVFTLSQSDEEIASQRSELASVYGVDGDNWRACEKRIENLSHVACNVFASDDTIPPPPRPRLHSLPSQLDDGDMKISRKSFSDLNIAAPQCSSTPQKKFLVERRSMTNLTSSNADDSGVQVSPDQDEDTIQRRVSTWAMNITRIDKDVHRCDRTYPFFSSQENLTKLRNIMCTFVWRNLDVGYIQGMCDLCAPLLVVFEDEVQTYTCFAKYMERMLHNFPTQGSAMDEKFTNMRSLIQILDSDLFEVMQAQSDSTHFYFCYRWFLLDFKREFAYADVFLVWETIWCAHAVTSTEFSLFVSLALVEYYREVIINNDMDFTDIIRFFNEMAEKHSGKKILAIARDLVKQVSNLIDTRT